MGERSDLEWYKLKPKGPLKRWFEVRNVQCRATVPTLVETPDAAPLRCFKNVLDYCDKYPERWAPCWGWSVMPSFHCCNVFGLECHVVLRNLKTDALVDITPDIVSPGRPKVFVVDPSVESLVSSGTTVKRIGACRRCTG